MAQRKAAQQLLLSSKQRFCKLNTHLYLWIRQLHPLNTCAGNGSLSLLGRLIMSRSSTRAHFEACYLLGDLGLRSVVFVINIDRRLEARMQIGSGPE